MQRIKSYGACLWCFCAFLKHKNLPKSLFIVTAWKKRATGTILHIFFSHKRKSYRFRMTSEWLHDRILSKFLRVSCGFYWGKPSWRWSLQWWSRGCNFHSCRTRELSYHRWFNNKRWSHFLCDVMIMDPAEDPRAVRNVGCDLSHRTVVALVCCYL